MDYVYFPTTSIVSLVYTMEDGATVEMGLAGSDGVVGIALFLGGDTTPNRAVVQIAGGALRMPAQVLQEEFKRGSSLQLLLLRYTRALITQISQTAVCNRLHSVEQRLCRWLLLTHDRVKVNELQLTQEFIANMLGVRREGVTHAACHLQAAGLIQYARGRITILDRKGLEATVCECYRVVKQEFGRLLGQKMAA
jgi:CRP-like cAMP-binding protein